MLGVALVRLLAPIQKGQAPKTGGRGLMREQDVSILGRLSIGAHCLLSCNLSEEVSPSKVALCGPQPAMPAGESMWHPGPGGSDPSLRS